MSFHRLMIARRNRQGLPVQAGLGLWLKADGILGLADGAAVATWPDSSGNGRDGVQGSAGARPTWHTGVLNGRPVVRFDGTSDELPITTGLDLVRNVTGATGFAVWKVNSHASFRCLFGFSIGTGSGGRFQMGRWTDGTNRLFTRRLDADGSISTFSTGVASAGDWSIDAVRRNWASGEHAHFRNGAASGTSTSGTTGATSDTDSQVGVVGTNVPGGGTEWIGGDVAEVIIYQRALSDAQVAAVNAYLRSKYAVY